jgi:enoyl-CoA hydratase/carnithine racemase
MDRVTIDRSDDGIVTITLQRPEALNALDHAMVGELTAVLDDLRRDRECRVVILTGAGRAFCAGLDLKAYGDDELVERDGVTLRTFERQREIADLAHRLHELPQPVVAAVNGPAVGGGLALICASDIRIASTSSIFAVSFITAGFSACDIGVSWLLPRLMGAGRAHELMLTGRRFGPEEALAGGLLSRVVAPELLLDTAHDVVELILGNSPVSVELTKVGMWHALEIPAFRTAVEFENRQQTVTALTDDRVEATAAFLEKRAPEFRRR